MSACFNLATKRKRVKCLVVVAEKIGEVIKIIAYQAQAFGEFKTASKTKCKKPFSSGALLLLL